MDAELKQLLEDQGKAFQEFKAANDEELKAKADGKAVSALEEKTARINEELDKLAEAVEGMAKKGNRLDGPADASEALNAEHKAAFQKWVRKGDDADLLALHTKGTTINVGTQAEGGYALPIDQDKSIMRLLTDKVIMRQICRVMSMSTTDYRKLVNLGGVNSGWVGETDARPNTASPEFTQITPTFGEIYANPMVTQRALDDLFFDVESELSRDVAEEFAKQENIAFFSGNGTNKPVGLLTATMTTEADGVRDFGKFQYIATGVANAFPATNPADKLLDLIYALHESHLNSAKFLVNRTTLALIRKWKDNDNNYLWQPSMQMGEPSKIFGYSVYTDAQMPSVAANALCVAFGDFSKAYWIIDRIGTRSLRDPYTNKPYVQFYTTKRVGSMIVDTTAVKFLKCEV